MSLRVTITNEDDDEFVVATARREGGRWMLIPTDDTLANVRVDQMLDEAEEWDREPR